MTASNGESCGLLWPGTEFPVNNFLGEEDIHPLGLHLGPAGARFRTMMTPSLLVEADGGVLALGTGGSNRIRTAMLQVVRHIVGDREDPGRAVLHPRIHVEGDSVQVEVVNIPDGFVAAVAGTSRRPGCFDRLHLYFGGVHVAARRGDGGLEAVGDPRRDGVGRVV
jgi:gamma-glutamyltranspeptidase/glutathione hydrolase